MLCPYCFSLEKQAREKQARVQICQFFANFASFMPFTTRLDLLISKYHDFLWTTTTTTTMTTTTDGQTDYFTPGACARGNEAL